ncbi:MAG: AbrB/MazE/SpoVT family DNA-binding domain-containing protein [Chloroflexi bacterium]|nr:AbrB/MazE/SpoVT family DNA-binding domain-containing protein [Chloroflexota bacterium]
MQAVVTQVSAKYQVVIPKIVRETLGLRPQDALLFIIDGETVIMRPRPTSLTKTLRGLHQELWPDPDRWLEEERSSWA